jgi:hypothetical protein
VRTLARAPRGAEALTRAGRRSAAAIDAWAPSVTRTVCERPAGMRTVRVPTTRPPRVSLTVPRQVVRARQLTFTRTAPVRGGAGRAGGAGATGVATPGASWPGAPASP